MEAWEVARPNVRAVRHPIVSFEPVGIVKAIAVDVADTARTREDADKTLPTAIAVKHRVVVAHASEVTMTVAPNPAVGAVMPKVAVLVQKVVGLVVTDKRDRT